MLSNRWKFFFLIFQSLELFAGSRAAVAMAPADRAQFADGLYARGLYDLAVKEYLPLFTNQPPVTNLDAVIFRAGECFRYLRQRESAVSAYDELVRRFPDSSYRWRGEFRRAELFATGGQYLDAINRFRTLVDANPPPDILASALYYLGYSQDRMNLREEAERAYRRVVKEFPDSPFFSYACIGLAELYKKDAAHAGELRGLYEKAARAPATPRVGAEAWFQLGELAYRDRDFARAAEAYEQLLMRYPSDERAPDARLPAAWSFHNTKRYADALKLAEGALKKVDDAAVESEWHYLQANCLRQLKRADEARAIYEHLLGTHKSGGAYAAAAAYELALIAFANRDFEAVTRYGAYASGTNDYVKDFYWMLAEANLERTNRDEAAKFYDRILAEFSNSDRAAPAAMRSARLLQERGAWREAAARYREVAGRKDAGDLAADALYASAYCLGEAGDREGVLRDLDALAGRFPAFGRMDDALYRKAQIEVEQERADAARASLDRLLKEFPRSERAGAAHYLLGTLLEKGGQFDVAEYHYRTAESKGIEKKLAAQIRFRRASVLQRQGRNDEAAAVLQELVGTPEGKDMPEPLLEWLARHQLQNERYAEADAAATALAGRSSDPAWRQIAWYTAGRGRQATGNAAGAREAFEQALAVEAKTREGVEAALYLGRVGLETKDFELAERGYSRAAEMASSDDLLDIRARAYFGLGEAAEAREQWEDASRYFMSVAVLFDDPKIGSDSLRRAAAAFDKLGRAADRDRALAELKQRYPDN